MAKKQAKPTTKRDTTVITPAYKVKKDELHNPKVAIGGRDDSTKAKIAANFKHVQSTVKRNFEREKEGKPKISPKTNPYNSLVNEKSGKTFKERPIKVTDIKKKK